MAENQIAFLFSGILCPATPREGSRIRGVIRVGLPRVRMRVVRPVRWVLRIRRGMIYGHRRRERRICWRVERHHRRVVNRASEIVVALPTAASVAVLCVLLDHDRPSRVVVMMAANIRGKNLRDGDKSAMKLNLTYKLTVQQSVPGSSGWSSLLNRTTLKKTAVNSLVKKTDEKLVRDLNSPPVTLQTTASQVLLMKIMVLFGSTMISLVSILIVQFLGCGDSLLPETTEQNVCTKISAVNRPKSRISLIFPVSFALCETRVWFNI